MINIIVAGFKGRMGSTAVNMVIEHPNFNLVGLLDPLAKEKNINEIAGYTENNIPIFNEKEKMITNISADVWIDFTIPSVAYENTLFALSNQVRPVIGTTGFSDEQISELISSSKKQSIGGLIAPNFAIGAVLLMEFSKKAVEFFPDVEIIELHHDNKLDAPSGTAIKTAELMSEKRQEKIQGNPNEKESIQGARGADFEGMRIHSVRLPGLIAHQEVIFGGVGEGLTIRHDSYDRRSFMTGVALGCEKVMDYNELVYGLENFL